MYYKYPNKLLELSDYVHWAIIGMIESIERYNPTKGDKFEAFAIFRVRGEILNNLSKVSDYSAYVSARNKRVSEKVSSIMPSSSQHDEFEDVLHFIKLFSLGVSIEDASTQPDDSLCQYETDHLLAKHIKSLMAFLNENEKFVIESYYQNHLSFIDISSLLNVSKGRVSQIHASALNILAKKLSSDISL